MDTSPFESLLFNNYKHFVNNFLDITNWNKVRPENAKKFVENKIKVIQEQILLNEKTKYWRYEQSLCILLRLSTYLNPFEEFRASISSQWNSILDELNNTWVLKRKGIRTKMDKFEGTEIFDTEIGNLHPDLLFNITIGGSNFSLSEAILFSKPNTGQVNSKFCFPCGRFIPPEYLVPGTPGFMPSGQAEFNLNVKYWKEVFNIFYGRIPSIFRIVYILPEYAESLLNSYKVIMEDQRYGVLPLYYRHFIGILCSSLYDNDYMIKLEMQMFVFNNGPIEWLEKPSECLPSKFFTLFEFLNCITFEPANISNELMNRLIGMVSGTQVWTVTELCHILCIATTIQSISQLSCSFGLTCMDHWELGPDPLEGTNCDGNTCFNPSNFERCNFINEKQVFSGENGENSILNTPYYDEILSEYFYVDEEDDSTISTTGNNSIPGKRSNVSISSLELMNIPTFGINKFSNLRIFSRIPISTIRSFLDNSRNRLFCYFEKTNKTMNIRGDNHKEKDKILSKTRIYSDNPSKQKFEETVERSDIEDKKWSSRYKCERDISTLNRMIDMLNYFPPQGDIFGISKDEVSLFRSNSVKHRADRVLLSSVMNSKPKLLFDSISSKFKLSSVDGKNEDNSIINSSTNIDHISVEKKLLVNGNAHLMNMLNGFSIQMLEYEFYSESAWSILSIYSGECSKCIKEELDILLFNCNKKITTVCDIYKVPTTNPIRSSIWSYVFKLCGIVKFEMTELVHNSFLPLELKVLLKKTIRFPQRILRSDFERCRNVFSYRELIYYLIVVCKAKQAVTILCSIQTLSNILRCI
ncbi:sestrin-1 isoform X1 [Cryptosporidium felis]|nr:sestrin-1 isoform X1 [Cryptosporidium felis]